MRVSAGSALNYATMPGIFPRLKDILFSGFGPVTQLIAVICFMAGLLPKNHPCFSKEKGSQYGLVKILAAAADTIEFKWKNIDKIIVFGLIVCGTVMMWLFIAGVIFFFVSSPSFATGFTGVFQTIYPEDDVAFMMLDKVLGVPGVYNSSISMAAGFPEPFHVGLHELFRFYSLGIFVIALVIFLYHVIHWVFEITQTGKVTEHLSDEVMAPYADSPSTGFSWLPFRFVMAFGLLLPFGDGFNSAQWITMYTAKYGSGLATNTWINFNSQTGDTPLGEENKRLIAKPPSFDNTGLIKSLFMMSACRYSALMFGGKSIEGYIVNGTNSKAIFTGGSGPGFMGQVAPDNYNATPQKIASGDTSDHFIQILTYAGFSDIKIVLGEFDSAEPDKYKEYPGGVLPVCGEITVPVTGRTGEALFAAEGYFFAVLNVLFMIDRTPPSAGNPQPDDLKEMLFALIREFRRTSSLVNQIVTTNNTPDFGCYVDPTTGPPLTGPCKDAVLPSYWNGVMDKYYSYAFAVPPYSAYDFVSDQDTAYNVIDPNQKYIHATPTSFSAVGATNPLLMTIGILKYGWGGAGLWYNKIAERNGALYSAAAAVPSISKFPMVMEEIRNQRAKTDTKISGEFCEKFNPRKSGTTSTNLPSEKNQFDSENAKALYGMCAQLFENQLLSQDGVTRTTVPSNPLEKAIQMFFSEFRIFDRVYNKEVTPMAQLTSIGRILIDKAILGVTASAASYAAGGVAYMSAGSNGDMEKIAAGLGTVGDMTMLVALMGLSSGFVLYYMLPIMPFIYFFFAVGRWVKTIFEALVGVPLWALAHMRVGGPGLPGNAAIGGYFLLLEILIRPILTVFSLVAAFAIFSALTVGLNTVFGIVNQNLMGNVSPAPVSFNALSLGDQDSYVAYARSMIDQFFLSVFYIFLVYTIGTGCFKLIDLIPDNIMRWSGAGVQAFGASDVSDDMIEEWQWSLPQRFNIATRNIGSLAKDTLYKPGEDVFKRDKMDRMRQEKQNKVQNVDQAEKNRGAGSNESDGS